MNFGHVRFFRPEPPPRLILLVSSAVPLSDAITLVHLGPAHCSSNLCQGGSSSRRSTAVAVATAAPSQPSRPSALSLSISTSLFARRALNYGGNATKSSGLIELLLESQCGVRLTKKKEEEKKTHAVVPPSCAAFPPPLSRPPTFRALFYADLARGSDLSPA